MNSTVIFHGEGARFSSGVSTSIENLLANLRAPIALPKSEEEHFADELAILMILIHN